MKPLNTVEAAGLEHAVMSLNLGSAGVNESRSAGVCVREAAARLPDLGDISMIA